MPDTALVAEACEWAGAGLGVELPEVVADLHRLSGLCRALAPL
ncbi:hypothetical protein DFAR_1430016 [Desulfarculales bacterium]